MKSTLWDLSVTEQQKHLGSPSLPTQEPHAPSTPPRAPGCGSSRGHAVTAPSQSHRKGKTLRTNSRHVLPPVQDAPGVGRPQGTPRPSEGPHHPPSVSHVCSSISPMRIVGPQPQPVLPLGPCFLSNCGSYTHTPSVKYVINILLSSSIGSASAISF